jgi:hypothetical protein
MHYKIFVKPTDLEKIIAKLIIIFMKCVQDEPLTKTLCYPPGI